MKGEFSDMEESFIKMALESVHYNEANFKRMVEIYKKSGYINLLCVPPYRPYRFLGIFKHLAD